MRRSLFCAALRVLLGGAEAVGFEPTEHRKEFNRFGGGPDRPLWHTSTMDASPGTRVSASRARGMSRVPCLGRLIRAGNAERRPEGRQTDKALSC